MASGVRGTLRCAKRRAQRGWLALVALRRVVEALSQAARAAQHVAFKKQGESHVASSMRPAAGMANGAHNMWQKLCLACGVRQVAHGSLLPTKARGKWRVARRAWQRDMVYGWPKAWCDWCSESLRLCGGI